MLGSEGKTAKAKDTRKPVSQRTLDWVQRLVWILIYGGLLVVSVGLFLTRGGEDGHVLGVVLMVKGGLVAAAGVFLIWLRSRLRLRQ
jgi:hypothetical protein